MEKKLITMEQSYQKMVEREEQLNQRIISLEQTISELEQQLNTSRATVHEHEMTIDQQKDKIYEMEVNDIFVKTIFEVTCQILIKKCNFN